MLVEPALHRFANMLVLPAGDASLLAAGAVFLDRAALAGVGPVAAQDQPIFLVRISVRQRFAGRTEVDVLVSHVAEVLFAKAPPRHHARGHRLGQCDRDASIVAGQDLLTTEVAAVGDGIELPHRQTAFAALAMGESCARSDPSLITSCAMIR